MRPTLTAEWRGVHPSSSLTFNKLLESPTPSKIFFTTSTCPLAAATCTRVLSSSSRSRRAFLSSSSDRSSKTAGFPFTAASNNASASRLGLNPPKTSIATNPPLPSQIASNKSSRCKEARCIFYKLNPTAILTLISTMSRFQHRSCNMHTARRRRRRKNKNKKNKKRRPVHRMQDREKRNRRQIAFSQNERSNAQFRATKTSVTSEN
uniref:Uncharacterized protein n=1 Tax=Physcomitrium patens TaxID=3218 RepID=A0A2K1KGM7_PHYPA|nr:hypothetical protein PHYPA_009309 [Physcomitrium patens]